MSHDVKELGESRRLTALRSNIDEEESLVLQVRERDGGLGELDLNMIRQVPSEHVMGTKERTV